MTTALAPAYNHGLPFSTSLIATCESLQHRIDNGKASMMIIEGAMGEGKTTLAVHVADYFASLVAGYACEIDLRKQLAMGGLSFQEKLQICIDAGLPVLIYDEAGDFSRRGALTAFNKQLARLFETYRTFKIMIIVVLPNFNVLDKMLFDNAVCRVMLRCYDRTAKRGNFKAYSLYRMHYLRDNMRKLVVPQHAYSKTRPNFYGHFLNLSPERAALLDKISSEAKQNILSENILTNRGLMTPEQMAHKLGRSKQWINLKTNALNIKHISIYKKKRYYDSQALDQLQQELERGRK